MLTDKERTAFHRNTALDGKPLSVKERETLIKRFLPPTPSDDTPALSPYRSRGPSQTPPYQSRKPARRKPIRTFVSTRIHLLLHVIILALFGLYIRLRQAYHAVTDRVLAVLFYHHRTPDWIRRDIQSLNKIPEHLSVILSLDEERLQPSGLESVLNDVGDLAAWCASAGIQMVSIYERKGNIMAHLPHSRIVTDAPPQAFSSGAFRRPTSGYAAHFTVTLETHLMLHAQRYPSEHRTNLVTHLRPLRRRSTLRQIREDTISQFC